MFSFYLLNNNLFIGNNIVKLARKIDKIETALPSNIESIREFLATPDRCCSKNCVSHFYETQYEALYQFGKDLEKCSQEA